MRLDPIEISLGRTSGRRGAERRLRPKAAAPWKVVEPTPPTTDAIDEAFAGMMRSDSHVRRVDSSGANKPAADAADDRRPNSLAVVTQLSAQLDAMDRQREQLAKLLRDIEVTTLAD